MRPRHVVYADLSEFGCAPMPVAAFYTRFAARSAAWLTCIVSGLTTRVVTLNSN
jgi:hypothetical protein